MEEEKIRRTIEELDLKIPSDKLEELVQALVDRKKNPLEDGDSKTFMDGDVEKTIYFHTLRDQLEKETDWKKRASIAAKMVSLNLDN